MTENTIIYQSSKIFYRTTGAGRPIILIHGFGEDGQIWDQQVAFLKDHFYLIIPDLPGSGRSEMIKDMSIEGLAEVIKAVMDLELSRSPLQGAEGVEGAFLLGHSMGGYITLAFAEKYPNLLSSFALVHSSAFADSEEKKSVRLKSIEFIKRNGAHEFLKAAIAGLFISSGPSRWPLELIEKGKDFTDEAIIQYYQAIINRPDRTAVLKTFSNPILFIIGEQDKAVPFQQSLQQCYLPNRSHIHILRNSAHMGMLEEEEKVNNIIFQFYNTFLTSS